MSNLYVALFGWMALVTLIALALWLTSFLCSLPWKKSSEAEVDINSNNTKSLSIDEMPTYPIGLHGGEKKKLEITGETSDGHHTFNELYHYRMLYNAGFFNMLYIDDLSRDTSDKEPIYRVHKSKRHSDGEECFGGGWFIVMAYLDGKQISNHYELKDWYLFDIPERTKADEWDGHTPDDVENRIKDFLKGAN